MATNNVEHRPHAVETKFYQVVWSSSRPFETFSCGSASYGGDGLAEGSIEESQEEEGVGPLGGSIREGSFTVAHNERAVSR